MISRDGACISLWQESVAPYETRSHKISNRIFDVAIVGGGITGITLALLLQKAGKKCIVLEANSIGYGTTGGTTAHLNTLLDTPYPQIIKDFSTDAAKIVAKAANDAIDLIESHVEEYGIQCGFERTSAYLFSQDTNQTDELRDILDACNDVGVKSSYINYIPLPIPFQQAIEVPGQAKFNPLRYVHSLARAFEDNGGVILQQCRVKDAEEEDDRIKVETSLENVTAYQL